MTRRQKLMESIADTIIDRSSSGVYRVAVDGLDGAGKTTMADELTNELRSKNQVVIRSSSDFFHNPRETRYKLGRQSPEGFFLDSFNYSKMKELLLEPLSNDGSGLYYERYFNHLNDAVEKSIAKKVEGKAVLVVDGIFLHRKELLNYWDFSIFLNVTRPESLRRCYVRDGSGSPDPEAAENRRYVLGQKMYLAECKPKEQASLVVNNEIINSPFIEN